MAVPPFRQDSHNMKQSTKRALLGRILPGACVAGLTLPAAAQLTPPPGEAPAITPPRISQADITGGVYDFTEIRAHGLRIFSTNFNKLDGYGDGPVDFTDPVTPGHRPTLQNNGTFLRVNGLDSQSCMECHSVGSSATAPFTFAIGGVGGSNNNAIFQPRSIDVDDDAFNGYAFFDGRYINPPFLFGSGGVELLGKEMTMDLQAIKTLAENDPDVSYDLVSKGVSFGSITFDSATQTLLTDQVEGVDPDLVVRPFGRKGEFATVRAFDLGALEFHLGMQPQETAGYGVDGDGDGVVDEILDGEVSALHIFNTNLERPVRQPSPVIGATYGLFVQVGCVECHIPNMDTNSTMLTYSFPEVETDPTQNVFLQSDLSTPPTSFRTNQAGGIRVNLFSDLKRHDMGPGLAESFGSELDSFFITARLWGVADTAPYMHDGRALTLTDAIMAHGGEAQAARDAFAALSDADKVTLLDGLRLLKTPTDPAGDL